MQAQLVDPEVGILKQWQGYPKGINTKEATHLIDDLECQDAQNVMFDEESCVVMRGGTQNAYQTLAASGSIRLSKIFTTTTGKSYAVVVCSTTLAYASTDLNDRTWKILISTIPLTTTVWGAQYKNKMFIGTYDGDRWYLDSSLNLVISTTIPQARDCISYYDKLLCVNVNETEGNSKIAYCAVGDYMNWRVTDQLYADRDDGDEFKAVRNFNGKLYGFKGRSTYLLSGFDDDFYSNDGQERILTGIGCKYRESIAEKGNIMYFASDRGIEAFDGGTVANVPISRRIEAGINGFSQMKEIIASWAESTQTDFSDNTSRYNVTLTSYGIVQNAVDFSTSARVSLNDVYNILGYSVYNNIPYLMYSEDLHTGTAYNIMIATYEYTVGWSTFVAINYNTGLVSNSGSFDVDSLGHVGDVFDNTGVIIFSSWTGTVLSSVTVINASGYGQELKYTSANVPAIVGRYINAGTTTKLLYSKLSGVAFTTTTVIQSFAAPAIQSAPSLAFDSSDNPYIAYAVSDGANVGKVFVSSWNGTFFSSSVVLTAAITTAVGAVKITIDANNMPHVASVIGTDTYYSSWTSVGWKTTHVYAGASAAYPIDIKVVGGLPYITSSDGSNSKLIISSLTALGTFTTSYQLASVYQQGYMAKYSNNVVSVAEVATNAVNLINFNGASYVSDIHNATTNDMVWTYWTTLTANTQNTGTVSFYNRTGTSAADVLTKAWVAVSTGALVSSNNGSFAQYKIIMSSPAGQNVVNSVSLNYAIDQRLKPICSIIRDNRLWVSGATYPSTINDTIYAYDINQNWTRFKGINAGSFYEFGNELFIGDSNQAKIHKYSTDYTTDNGAAIDVYYKTKDFDMGTYSYDKSLNSLWFYTLPSVIYSSATVEYFVDKSTTAVYSHDFSLAGLPGYMQRPIVYKINADDSRWRYMNMKFSNFQKLYGYIVKYLKHGEREQ